MTTKILETVLKMVDDLKVSVCDVLHNKVADSLLDELKTTFGNFIVTQ